MREIKCKYCGKISLKYEREGKLFCNRNCYMNWKRLNPNKRPYKDRIIVSGYSYIYKPEHPFAIKNKRYIAEHRLMAEKKLGRYLNNNEIAHHINGNTLDNRLENIEILIKSKHDYLRAKHTERNKNGQFKAKI